MIPKYEHLITYSLQNNDTYTTSSLLVAMTTDCNIRQLWSNTHENVGTFGKMLTLHIRWPGRHCRSGYDQEPTEEPNPRVCDSVYVKWPCSRSKVQLPGQTTWLKLRMFRDL